MRAITLLLVPVALLFAASTADAKSCSTFAKITGYDDATKQMSIKIEKGNAQKFFPKPDGSPSTSKVPKKCKTRVLKMGSYEVRTEGGRLSITQVRQNFTDNMMNDPDDPKWVPNMLKQLIADKTEVVVVLRPERGMEKERKPPHWVSTIYMPITQAELDEIARLDAQAEDVD